MRLGLDQVLDRLHSGGRRVTVQRRAVLVALRALGCARDVDTIHARARRIHPRVGLVTVYRTLEALVAEGVAQRVVLGDGRARYELGQEHGHHHHLVCLSCGSVERLDECHVQAKRAGRRRGFTVTAHRLEMFGYCAKCGAPA